MRSCDFHLAFVGLPFHLYLSDCFFLRGIELGSGVVRNDLEVSICNSILLVSLFFFLFFLESGHPLYLVSTTHAINVLEILATLFLL